MPLPEEDTPDQDRNIPSPPAGQDRVTPPHQAVQNRDTPSPSLVWAGALTHPPADQDRALPPLPRNSQGDFLFIYFFFFCN